MRLVASHPEHMSPSFRLGRISDMLRREGLQAGCSMPESRITDQPLRTERLSDGRRRLLGSLEVKVPSIDKDGSPESITVADGFVTDFSSIPTIFQWVVRWSKVDVAGVVHDWLYAQGTGTRARADEIWRIVALSGEHRANRLQAYVCWLCLRLCGGWAWRRHAEYREQHSRPNEGAGP